MSQGRDSLPSTASPAVLKCTVRMCSPKHGAVADCAKVTAALLASLAVCATDLPTRQHPQLRLIGPSPADHR